MNRKKYFHEVKIKQDDHYPQGITPPFLIPITNSSKFK